MCAPSFILMLLRRDRLELHLSNQRPNKEPLLCLESWSKLPTTLYRLKALEGIQRREQTAASVLRRSAQ